MTLPGLGSLLETIEAPNWFVRAVWLLQESRARWNSIDGILIFGWSGSALLGGVLIDRYGFDVTFCITATMQAIGTCFTVPLLFLVPIKEAAHQPSDAVSTNALAAVGANTGLASTDVEVLPDGQADALGQLDSEADAVDDLEQPLLLPYRQPRRTSINYSSNGPARSRDA